VAIVVSDTSAIAALCHLGLGELLRSFYQEVIIPPTVAMELKNPLGRRPIVDVAQFPFITIRAPQDLVRVAELQTELERGEAEAIALAVQLAAEWLLIDEDLGRQVASRLGLKITGVLGILLRAKGAGMIAAVAPLMDRLTAEIDFHIAADLRNRVIRLAGEQQ